MGADSDSASQSGQLAQRVAIRLILAVSRIVPVTVFYILGWVLGSLLYLVSRRYRRLLFSNLDLAYGDELSRKQKRWIAPRSCVTFIQEAALLLKYVNSTSWQMEKMVRVEHEDRLKDALAKGGGVALVTGHLSSFTLAVTRLVRAGYRVAVLRRRQGAEEMLNYIVTRAGVRSFYHKESLLPVGRFLKDGGAVLFTIDQNARLGVPVPFFGVPAKTFTAPVRFAVSFNAVTLPIFMRRERWGKYVLTIEEPVELIRSKSDEAVYENLLKLSLILEKYIRKCPEQWLWLHRRWGRDV
jgi:lauroyl/myristoyl acyltransferase